MADTDRPPNPSSLSGRRPGRDWGDQLPGVPVGENAIVATGAVARRDVPPDPVAAGGTAGVVKVL